MVLKTNDLFLSGLSSNSTPIKVGTTIKLSASYYIYIYAQIWWDQLLFESKGKLDPQIQLVIEFSKSPRGEISTSNLERKGEGR